MGNCKWCGKDHELLKSLTKHGYCESCEQKIRADIVSLKDRLDSLYQQAQVDAPQEDEIRIINAIEECHQALLVYKDKSVPFFKSNIDEMCNRILRKMSIENRFFSEPSPPCAPVTAKTYKKKKRNLPVVIGFVVSWLLIFRLAYVNLDLSKKQEKLLDWVMATKNLNEIQGTYITQLEDELAALRKPVPTSRSYTLQNGNFVSGKNFTPGIYNIKAVSGKGNVSSDNAYDGGINAIMGIDEDRDFYQRSYKNISLPEGTTLSVDGVKIQITLVE